MKRFLLFAGSSYYPLGGWKDFIKDFDSLEDAKTAAEDNFKGKNEWYHVVDTEQKGIAWASK